MKFIEFRHIAVLAMIGIVLLSGLPAFVSEDANHDRVIDIQDAVIRLQTVTHVNSSHNSSGMRGNFEICENVLGIVAGLKKIVPPAFEPEKSFSPHFCFLTAGIDLLPIFFNYDKVIDLPVQFSCFHDSPLYQPPIFS
jgi:hypothetical protein